MTEPKPRRRYHEEWAEDGRRRDGLEGYLGMVDDFGADEVDAEDKDILFAAYNGDSYNGEAFVLFQRDGKLFEVHATHCSCDTLYGQWKPEETSWAQVAARPLFSCDLPTRLALSALILENTEGRP